MISAFDVARYLEPAERPQNRQSVRFVGLLFDEPSTRNRFSSAVAAVRAGATPIFCDDMRQMSFAKGERLDDTMFVLSGYFDVIAVRSRLRGFARLAQQYSSRPVINLGDGSNEHPTQALAAVLSIRKHFQTTDRLHAVLWGDLELSRSAHSFFIAAALTGLQITLLAYRSYELPRVYLDLVRALCPKTTIAVAERAGDVPPADILYLNREQWERRRQPMSADYFAPPHLLRDSSLLLHPLPRGNELPDAEWNRRQSQIRLHVQSGLEAREIALTHALYGSVTNDSWPSAVLNTQSRLRCNSEECAAAAHHRADQEEPCNLQLASGPACAWCLQSVGGVA